MYKQIILITILITGFVFSGCSLSNSNINNTSKIQLNDKLYDIREAISKDSTNFCNSEYYKNKKYEDNLTVCQYKYEATAYKYMSDLFNKVSNTIQKNYIPDIKNYIPDIKDKVNGKATQDTMEYKTYPSYLVITDEVEYETNETIEPYVWYGFKENNSSNEVKRNRDLRYGDFKIIDLRSGKCFEKKIILEKLEKTFMSDDFYFQEPIYDIKINEIKCPKDIDKI